MTTPMTLPNPLPYAASQQAMAGTLPDITWVGIDGVRHYLSGPLAAANPTHGVKLQKIKGLDAPFKHLTQQGAEQDGDDWQAAYFDAVQVDMTISINGTSAMDRRGVYRSWRLGWSPYQTGKLTHTTREFGSWWLFLRKQGPRTTDISTTFAKSEQAVDWSTRGDFPFWQSFPSTSTLVATSSTMLQDPTGVNAPNFLGAFNRGNIPVWPQILLQGPGIFSMADNGSTDREIGITLTAGQTVLLQTLPRLRSAVEVNTNANVYPLLSNRFSQYVPGQTVLQEAITVTGAVAGVTAAQIQLTPCMDWPE